MNHHDHKEHLHQKGASSLVHHHDEHNIQQVNHSSASEGYDEHSGHHIHDFKTRFWICLILSIPVLILSDMIQHWLGFSFHFVADRFVLAGLSTFIFLYGGWPFLSGLWKEVKSDAIGMMTLIGVAISVAWAYSFLITLGLKGMDFYWEMATLVVIMLFGHWMEMKSISGASKSLEMLIKMLPSKAHLVKGDKIIEVEIEQLKPGDQLIIKPGEKIPVDGVVSDGESELNESMLTGESRPVLKIKGSPLIGGSINGTGSLYMTVKNEGKEGYLNKVIKMVEEAQKVKSKTQHLANRAAKILTYISLGVGVLTLFSWLYFGYGFSFALERMVTVMVISCPHALGLAVPLVVAISTAVSANRGLLIRNRTAFENARKISTVVFDKTGTLTRGSHELSGIEILDNRFDKYEILRLASALEMRSEHHIAKGILKKAKEMNLLIPKADKFNYLPGKGIEGIVEGKSIQVIGLSYLKEMKIDVAPPLKQDPSETLIYVLIDNQPVACFTFEDTLRESSYEAIRVLQSKGIHTFLLTGDNEFVAKKVCDDLQMDGYLANVLPHQKQNIIKEFQAKSEFVAMTGDGVNDAPALAQADVGIAIGSGTDVAGETADIILINSDPMDIAQLILFGRATYYKMMQNLVWASGYNIIAIPLAAGVLYSKGILLSPALGAILMSLSTIVVAINAQLLKRHLR